MIRPILRSDVAVVLEMIKALAARGGNAHLVTATEASLESSLFSETPTVYGQVVEEDGVVVGYSLWHLTFSAWLGKPGIWLIDVFVKDECRGKGYGKAQLCKLAQLVDEKGYGRLEWRVRDANTSAIEFYQRLGAKQHEGWAIYSFDDQALTKLRAE